MPFAASVPNVFLFRSVRCERRLELHLGQTTARSRSRRRRRRRRRRRKRKRMRRRALLRCFSKSLPARFSRSAPLEFLARPACRASIRFFAAPRLWRAQCQEVSRPEFTLTHSIRSFGRGEEVRSRRRLLRPSAELVLPRFSYRRPFLPSFVRSFLRRLPSLVFIVTHTARRRCQLFTAEFWHDIVAFRWGEKN